MRPQGLRVEADACAAIAFQLAFDPEEDFGVDRLRAGVAAPQPPGHGGEKEQGQSRQHQQGREVDEILRLQHQAEDVELPRVQVEQQRLPAVPGQPGQAVETRSG